ncbi:MAG: uroporphyrinogen decarboxylase [Alphaproteobacteria bacterium]|nr:uroporphyrinogen decarboxylase [Alphaproteobacteria bacterium]
MAKPLLTVLNGEPSPVVPIWLMRQAGRYLPEYREIRARSRDFLDFCYTPDLAVEATLQPIRRFGLDGAIIFSDILVIPDALGQNVAFETGRGPVLDALTGPAAVEELSLERLRDHLAPVYEAIAEVGKVLPPSTTLIGFAGAPWTIASYMVEGGSSRDFAKLKTWAYGDPEGFETLIDLLIEAIAEHLCAQIDAGAEVVQIFDSWAGVLPKGAFDTWCLKPISGIIAKVKAAHPSVPVIAFPNRAGFFYQRIAKHSGADAISIDAMVPLAFAREALQPEVAVQGNLDPIMLVTGGEPMLERTRFILESLSEGPFVFNLGHGILPQTPPEHVAALVEEVHRWKK